MYNWIIITMLSRVYLVNCTAVSLKIYNVNKGLSVQITAGYMSTKFFHLNIQRHSTSYSEVIIIVIIIICQELDLNGPVSAWSNSLFKVLRVVFFYLVYNSALLLASCCCSFLLHVAAN
jgi:hypothetical protein